MDLFYLTGRASLPLQKLKESFSDYTDISVDQEEPKDLTLIDIVSFIVEIIIMFYAASLSWNCSGSYPVWARVIFATLAALFGFTYIILFIIFRADKCLK